MIDQLDILMSFWECDHRTNHEDAMPIKDSGLRKLIDRCRGLGASTRLTANGHLRIDLPTGKVMFCAPHHTSPRLFFNIRAQIRRAWPEKADWI